MIKLSDIRFKEKPDTAALRRAAAQTLGVPESSVTDVQILKLSTDARRKPDVRFVCTFAAAVDGEQNTLYSANISPFTPPEQYVFPFSGMNSENPPVITGMGPAGLFAALCLAEAGLKCIVLERGKAVEQRLLDVERFWRGGTLDLTSNVQFGEGGAGTFSDGKLTTGVNDKRIPYVLKRLTGFGAPEDIMYLSKPHIGTDKLRFVVSAVRARLIELGCDIRFGHRLSDIDISGGSLKSITADSGGNEYKIPADKLILAPGNSARDTFEMLQRRQIKLSAKSFSVGVRIEHLQQDIDTFQYGKQPAFRGLPASDYKLAVHLRGGRSVYTFCVCPGGQVVAAASEHSCVVTNGMSEYLRGGVNCNGALLVTVSPEDFGDDPLAGIDFQRKLEHAAFTAGGGGFYAPAQLAGDFLEKRASVRHKSVSPTYLPGVRYCNLWEVLPEFICKALAEALPAFGKRIAGFDNPDAVLTAVETRSSSPVRIDRENYETCGVCGVFPCGEGAGYAGGIMSAAVDGIKCAEALCGSFL